MFHCVPDNVPYYGPLKLDASCASFLHKNKNRITF